MPDLLHEYWEDDSGGEFGPIQMHNDQNRPTRMPNARLIFSLWAPSWFEAMQCYNERLDYGAFAPPAGVSNHIYSDGEVAEQKAYLKVRNHVSSGSELS